MRFLYIFCCTGSKRPSRHNQVKQNFLRIVLYRCYPAPT